MYNHWEWGVVASGRANCFHPHFIKKLIFHSVTVLTKPGLVGAGTGPQLVDLRLLTVSSFYKSLSRRLFGWKWLVPKTLFKRKYQINILCFQREPPFKRGKKEKRWLCSLFYWTQKRIKLLRCMQWCALCFVWCQIVIQGKPNSTEHVRTFDALTSTNGHVWRKEKALLPRVWNDCCSLIKHLFYAT